MTTALRFKPGQTIIAQGEPADRAFLIRTGAVKLIRASESGVEEVDRLGPGQVLGAAALTARRLTANSLGAVAQEPTEVLALSREEWLRVRQGLPDVVRAFLTRIMDRTEPGLTGAETASGFYPLRRICAVLKLMAGEAMRTDKHHRREGTDLVEVPLEYETVAKRLKDVFGLPVPAIESSLKKLHSVNLVRIGVHTRTKRKVNQDPATFRELIESSRETVKVVFVLNPDQMTAKIKRLVRELPELAAGSHDFMDIFDLAETLQAPAKAIYAKMAFGEIPPEVFLFHRDTVLSFAKEVGHEFFRRPSRRQIRAEDLGAINDLLFIDDAAIQEALTMVGPHNLAHILKESSEAVQSKVYQNMSPRMAAIVRHQVEDLPEVHQPLAIDQEFKLLEAVKAVKGLK